MIFQVFKLASKVATTIWVAKKAHGVIKTGSKAYRAYKGTKRVANVIKSLKKK